MTSPPLQDLRKVVQATAPAPLMLLPRLLGREELVGEHDLGRAAAVVELHRHEGVAQLRLCLPLPGVHEPFRAADLAVTTAEVENLPVGELPHAEAVPASDPKVDLRARCLVTRRVEPLLYLLRVRPCPEDLLPWRRECPCELERGLGLGVECSHGRASFFFDRSRCSARASSCRSQKNTQRAIQRAASRPG